MKRGDLVFILLLELFAIVVAGASFALIESKLIAGFVAGAYFVGFAVVSLRRILRWPRRTRALCLYPMLIHLFGISLPLLIARAKHADEGFTELRVFGLSGPEFHRLSTTVFAVLIAATVVDLLRTFSKRSRSR